MSEVHLQEFLERIAKGDRQAKKEGEEIVDSYSEWGEKGVPYSANGIRQIARALSLPDPTRELQH
jgi:hypothetical protein